MKPVGKPDAGNPHVRFDERGGETGRPLWSAPAPFLDSTAGFLLDIFKLPQNGFDFSLPVGDRLVGHEGFIYVHSWANDVSMRRRLPSLTTVIKPSLSVRNKAIFRSARALNVSG